MLKKEEKREERNGDTLKASLCWVYNRLVGYWSIKAQPTIDRYTNRGDQMLMQWHTVDQIYFAKRYGTGSPLLV